MALLSDVYIDPSIVSVHAFSMETEAVIVAAINTILIPVALCMIGDRMISDIMKIAK